jgi:NAD(P)-dependent dehydrogenase (short-subunit alcohol dehydrogenase family)
MNKNSSVSGQSIVEFPGIYAYSGSKHAVTVMTEGLRRELRDLGTNIRVTVST